MSHEVRCHHCSHFMGEADEALEFTGLFKKTRDREQIVGPRNSWRCPSCGWTNTFKRSRARWRDIETKARAQAVG